MRLIIMGPPNSGKAMLCGNLCYALGRSTKTKEWIEKLHIHDDPSVKYLEYMRQFDEERERGIGTLIGDLYPEFSTEKYNFTVTALSGTRNFIKNLIIGNSEADAAFLVISASKEEYDAGLTEISEHIKLLEIIGIQNLMVLITKMDTVDWSEQRFTDITKDFITKWTHMNYNPKNMIVIPISGKLGDNLLSNSPSMVWYKGPTLLQALDSLKELTKKSEMPLRIPIQDTFNVKGVGSVVCGRVEYGILKLGMIVKFAPTGIQGEVDSIQCHHEDLKEAQPGDTVGFRVKGVNYKEIRRGDVCGVAKSDPPFPVKSFIAQIIVINHPGEISVGYQPVIECHTAHVACKFSEFIEKTNIKTGKKTDANQSLKLKQGDVAIVKIVPIKPVNFEVFSQYPDLGRFAIRDLKMAVAVGIIKSIEKGEYVSRPIRIKKGTSSSKITEDKVDSHIDKADKKLNEIGEKIEEMKIKKVDKSVEERKSDKMLTKDGEKEGEN